MPFQKTDAPTEFSQSNAQTSPAWQRIASWLLYFIDAPKNISTQDCPYSLLSIWWAKRKITWDKVPDCPPLVLPDPPQLSTGLACLALLWGIVAGSDWHCPGLPVPRSWLGHYLGQIMTMEPGYQPVFQVISQPYSYLMFFCDINEFCFSQYLKKNYSKMPSPALNVLMSCHVLSSCAVLRFPDETAACVIISIWAVLFMWIFSSAICI